MRESMEIYPRTAAERAMKLYEVLLRASAGKIKWWQAAELMGTARGRCVATYQFGSIVLDVRKAKVTRCDEPVNLPAPGILLAPLLRRTPRGQSYAG